MNRRQLLDALGALAVDLEPVLGDVVGAEQLTALCRSARLAMSAAAVSVATVTDAGLLYVAADGEGAGAIVGTTLPAGSGIAGYVAMSGQSLAVDRVTDDARFARDTAERTGYVPTAVLVVPVVDDVGDVVGVISVLDRQQGAADALVLASSFAAQAALVIPALAARGRVARLLLDAVVDAAGAADPGLGPALRRALARPQAADDDLARAAALLADLRRLEPSVRARVVELMAEIASLATPRRRP